MFLFVKSEKFQQKIKNKFERSQQCGLYLFDFWVILRTSRADNVSPLFLYPNRKFINSKTILQTIKQQTSMKKLLLFLLMITSLNVMMVQGQKQPKIKVTNSYLLSSNYYDYQVNGAQLKSINYKGKVLYISDSTYKVAFNLQVSTPTKLKCSLYVMKKDFDFFGLRSTIVGITNYRFDEMCYLTDINQAEKIYEFPVTTVTKNGNVSFDWDGFTWEINGKRYPVRDLVAPVLEDAETGELLYFDAWNGPGMDFMPFSRFQNGIESAFEANQNSVSAHIYFAGDHPAKNATVYLGTIEDGTNCYIGALSNTVVNQGGKAIVEDMNRRSKYSDETAVIAYKELGPTLGGGKINDFVWENITDINGNIFIPKDDRQYILGIILEGENMAMNDGFYEGEINGAHRPSIPMPKSLQNREKNTGAPYHVEVPGTLAKVIGNKIDTITILSLSGSINGYDMETIYKMKKLTVLDMSRVDIVSGGDPYSDYYTLTDQTPHYLFNISNLSSIALSNNATEIQEKYLSGYSPVDLTTITLGINAKTFTYNSFPNLKKYIVPAKSNYFSSVDGVLFNKGNSPIDGIIFMYTIGQTALIGYPAAKSGDSYTIPEGTAIIGLFAFSGSNLKHLIMPQSVTLVLEYFYSTSLIDISCYNPIPPKAYSYTFDPAVTKSCKLYVPKGSKTAYAAAEGWKDFKNIIEMQATSVEKIPASKISVYSTPAGITVDSGTVIPVVIYSIAGQKVYESRIQGNTQINLNRGIYIVKAGESAQKVVVY